jgi:hypothetical protein
LRGGEAVAAPPFRKVERDANLPLSFAQQRLWFLNQVEPDSSSYNVPLAIQLQGNLDLKALEQTLSEIVRRHEVLRTTFRPIDGQPVQVISPPYSFHLEVEQLKDVPESRHDSLLRRKLADHSISAAKSSESVSCSAAKEITSLC